MAKLTTGRLIQTFPRASSTLAEAPCFVSEEKISKIFETFSETDFESFHAAALGAASSVAVVMVCKQ